jgi:uncharacterized delta-60 repeat protein
MLYRKPLIPFAVLLPSLLLWGCDSSDYSNDSDSTSEQATISLLASYDSGNGWDYGYDMVLDSSGNAYVTGSVQNDASYSDMAIWKYDSSGTLDTTFGESGMVTSDGAGGYSIALDGDGNVYVTGYSYSADTDSSDLDMALWKYDSSGALDTSFGEGGIVTYDGAGSAGYDDRGYSLALDSSGNIYVAGRGYLDVSYVMAIWKYGTTGVLDSDFGTAGIVTYSDDESVTGMSITLDSDSNIYVVGNTISNENFDELMFWKYSSAGDLTTTVSYQDNYLQADAGNSGAIVLDESNHALYIAGSVRDNDSTDMAIWKYDTDTNSLDTSFGTDGIVTYDAASDTDTATAIALNSSGSIYVTGRSDDASDARLMITAKYDSSGVLDDSFGTNGVATYSGENRYNYGYAIAINNSDEVYATGYSKGDDGDMAFWKIND